MSLSAFLSSLSLNEIELSVNGGPGNKGLFWQSSGLDVYACIFSWGWCTAGLEITIIPRPHIHHLHQSHNYHQHHHSSHNYHHPKSPNYHRHQSLIHLHQSLNHLHQSLNHCQSHNYHPHKSLDHHHHLQLVKEPVPGTSNLRRAEEHRNLVWMQLSERRWWAWWWWQ